MKKTSMILAAFSALLYICFWFLILSYETKDMYLMLAIVMLTFWVSVVLFVIQTMILFFAYRKKKNNRLDHSISLHWISLGITLLLYGGTYLFFLVISIF